MKLAKHGGKCTLGCLCELPAGWVPKAPPQFGVATIAAAAMNASDEYLSALRTGRVTPGSFGVMCAVLGARDGETATAIVNAAFDAIKNQKLSNGVNLRVIREAYGWDVDIDGEVHGLTAGDHGFEPTGIKLGPMMPKEST